MLDAITPRMASIKPDVRIFEDQATLSQAAAALFIESCARSTTERGRCLVALSGGNTPLRLYEVLAKTPYAEQVDWLHVHVFWGDERCVPPEDLESNYRLAHDVLLARVPIPAENVHRVQSEAEPDEAAIAYALSLKAFASPLLNWPRFDLVLLGMGDDGHTASLFPGSEVEMSTPTAAVTAAYQGRPANRVTITPLVFNAAHRVLFLVSGESKAETLASVLYGNYQPELLPAQRIRPMDGEVIWMLDQSAASRL
jgi:6-phosphogluconolactonase